MERPGKIVNDDDHHCLLLYIYQGCVAWFDLCIFVGNVNSEEHSARDSGDESTGMFLFRQPGHEFKILFKKVFNHGDATGRKRFIRTSDDENESGTHQLHTWCLAFRHLEFCWLKHANLR